ncbi:MAG: 2'-5' RNA ligase [Anaerolineaceae bacterium]|nr:MAG: 2'-5' RNA ligase [Anaerolineaceae bacterium]
MQSMMLRSFVAVEIPAAIQAAIARSTADLQKALPRPLVRWVAAQNLHLTLKFLGDVSPANLEKLAEALKVEAARLAGFELSVGGLGAFPTPRRPRVIWVGIEAPAALPALQRSVEAVAARMGYPPEERPFSPHLTLGRVGQNTSAADLARVRAAVEATVVGPLGTARVEALHIFKSDLQSSGSVYTHLYTLPFQS